MVIGNPKLKWNEDRDNLLLRFACSTDWNENTISIRIGPFKFKSNMMMNTFKSIKLTSEEVKEVCEIIKNRILNHYSISKDKNDIETKIEGNKILLTIK